MSSAPMQQQTIGTSIGKHMRYLLSQVWAHELNGRQVITTCSDPKLVGPGNIICTIETMALNYDEQRIMASNIMHAMNLERGYGDI